MANDTLKTRILLRNDALSAWENSELALAKGEVAIATLSTGALAEVRIGNGTTWANSLKLKIDTAQISGFQKYRLVNDIKNPENSATSALDPLMFQLQAGNLSANESDPITSQAWTTIGTPLDLNSTINGVYNKISELSDAVAETYLSNVTFDAWKDTVGLSAANSSNKVATMADIAGLVGAMHFKGPADSLESIPSAENGDVYIIPSSSKEYVYYDPDPTDEETSETSVLNWVELGDENLYATKNDVATISNGLSAEVSSLSNNVISIDRRVTTLETLSDTISETYVSASQLTNYYTKSETSSAAEISSEITGLTSQVDDLSTWVNTLSNTLTGDYYTKSETSSDLELATEFQNVYQEIEDSEIGLGATKIVRADGSIEYYNVVNEEIAASIIDDPSSVVEVYIGETVTGIDNGFFNDMTQLEKVVIPASVPSADIESQTFGNSLETIIFKDRTQAEAESIAADFTGADGKVTTWHDASQEWVTEQLNGLGTVYIKHGEVTQDELSGYFVLDCGGSALRTGEPTTI